MKEQIQQTVEELVTNYRGNELLIGKEKAHLPNREKIILLIKEIRRVMFPG